MVCRFANSTVCYSVLLSSLFFCLLYVIFDATMMKSIMDAVLFPFPFSLLALVVCEPGIPVRGQVWIFCAYTPGQAFSGTRGFYFYIWLGGDLADTW
jgi:hypothetical protein